MKQVRNIIIPGIFVLILLIFSYGASAALTAPQETVKLVGKYYALPMGLEGSPYLFDDWLSGTIFLKNGKVARDTRIRLDIVTDELLFYHETLKRVFVVDKATIDSFVVNPGRSDSMSFVKYSGEPIRFKLDSNSYIQMLYDGKRMDFFIRHKADIVKATESNSKNKVFSRTFFYVTVNGKTEEIKPRMRSFYSVFPQKKKEIRRLVSEYKLKRSTRENMVSLIKLLDQSKEFEF
ncbi:MAG TPA: hypothetical protein PKH79_02500 [Prolixibacteraceae bacterium]|nr:hypothetical protein [Prolixibacteraceae bacterium]HPS12913.1 hypothetical protein [Prolixibacteraceae bacterium]